MHAEYKASANVYKNYAYLSPRATPLEGVEATENPATYQSLMVETPVNNNAPLFPSVPTTMADSSDTGTCTVPIKTTESSTMRTLGRPTPPPESTSVIQL